MPHSYIPTTRNFDGLCIDLYPIVGMQRRIQALEDDIFSCSSKQSSVLRSAQVGPHVDSEGSIDY